MSTENLIGVDPLDWMDSSEVSDLKSEMENKDDETIKNNEEEIEYKHILERDFNIRHIENFHKELKSIFNKAKSIKIDVSQVAKLDTASIQLLASIKKSSEDKLIDIEFTNPNEYFKKSVNLLGLSSVFKT